MPDPWEVRTFSWRRALLGRYDVFHVHWPENLVRGNSWPGTARRLVTMSLLLVRLFLRRTPVVRTLHNVAPHEQLSMPGRLLVRGLDKLTTVWIRLLPWTPLPAPGLAVTIPHGHYRDWYRQPTGVVPVPGRLVFVGLLRPYKGVEELLGAFIQTADQDLSLRIAGNPADAGLADRVRTAAAQDSRVTARLEYLDDDALAEEIAQAEVVVLPYRAMHNSGAALLALSLDRPVLVPEGPTAEALVQEVGAEWVHRFGDDLGPDALVTAVQAAAASRKSRTSPDLQDRDWGAAGRAHAEAFASAITLRRRGSRAGRPDVRA